MVLILLLVIAVLMVGPLLLERLERHVPSRTERPATEGEET
jgi:hypothetical protein